MEVIESWNNRINWSDFHYQTTKDKTKLNNWDQVVSYEGNSLVFVMMRIRKGVDNPSFRMAEIIDDLIQNKFCYRDWTTSGLPLVDIGETYFSGFWFQKLKDAVLFQEMFSGTGNWMAEFETFHKDCLKDLN